MSAAEEADRAYVEFTRRLLEDMALGLDYPAAHYVRLFPACAARIEEDLAGSGAGSSADATVLRPHESDGPASDGAPLPRQIGRYEITGLLATGGMGRLFVGKHPETSERVVIKTARAGLAASHPKVIERLRREAAILGRLDHDRICPMTDVISDEERIFVVMPFIEGSTLEARLSDATSRIRTGAAPASAWVAFGTPGSKGLDAVVGVMEEVARAIHVAHEKGVVHRDLKPSNIIVRPDGQPVVLDFGLAVDLSDSTARRLTAYGDVIGTPSHMAPEQIRSEFDQIDRRTDVYALGVILYELLTCRRAFKEPTMRAIYDRVLSGRVESPRKVNPAIPRDLEAVCQKAMDTARKRRYATALDLAEDLRRVRTSERTVARPASTVTRAVRALWALHPLARLVRKRRLRR